MASCMKCPHRQDIERLREICLNCTIGKPECGLSHGGVSFVSMDAPDRPDAVLYGRMAPDYVPPGKKVKRQKLDTPLGKQERDNLLVLLNKFAELGSDYDDAGLICSMLAGKTIDRIARERGMSIQAVHARWKRIIGDDPTWATLANGMIGKGRGRKPSRKRQTQMELF